MFLSSFENSQNENVSIKNIFKYNYCNLIKTDLFKLKPKTQRKRKETQHQYYSKTRLRMKIQVVPELARQPLTANFNI
jgi:hypothetical protein